ncbi:hypothetical protein [Chryseobacterium limigenitum]|uniref:Head domain of trimeric autotransporter adhesin n=1 Tax=Chryseobacterium limigenitum TaxID=1612149 RepID=A0A1K2IXD8_9FLAO|nr:hypothetical protein [Chryseobacterium limigenitum]SFZ96958.1 hypothetical protein SAMN05216324_13117 [Chryseobacterium limigenitum]
MKKNIILLGALLVSSLAYSQVGINTPTPNATFDITGKPTDPNATDGLLAPRIAGNELKVKDPLYGTDQTGALVYVTAAASPTSLKTANVTEAGYYYFDGAEWTKGDFWKLKGNLGTSAGTNYLGTNDQQNLVFKVNSERVGYIQGDGVFDSLNNFEGTTAIGYGALGALTDGQNNTAFGINAAKSQTTGLQTTAIGEYALEDNTAGDYNTAIGANALNNTNGSGSTTGTRNVALGYSAGSVNVTGKDNTFIGAQSNADANNLNNATAIGFNAKVGISNALVLGNGANVGIGTSSPANKLHVIATADPVKLEGLQTGAATDNLVTVDANGVLTKNTVTSITGNAGNIGIGTTNPNTKLQVKNGDVYLETVGNGVIMKAPDGNCWRVRVNNGGTFASDLIACP